MNKYTLTALSVVMLTAQAAMADVTVYGKANVSLQAIQEDILDGKSEVQDNVELLSNASRLGVKGEEALTDDLKGIYQLEYEVAFDNGDADKGHPFKQRNIFVGLAGDDWGTFMVGMHDTPTKILGQYFDIFSDYHYGDIKNATVGESRVSNMMMYRSAAWGGFSFDVMLTPGEDSGGDVAPGTTEDNKRDGVADGRSVAFNYAMEHFNIGVSFDSQISQKLEVGDVTATQSGVKYGAETDLVRLVASYDTGVFGVNALLQKARQSEDDINSLTATLGAAQMKYGVDDTVYIGSKGLSGYYAIGQWKIKALALETEIDNDDNKLSQYVLGTEYKLGKNTKLFGYGATLEAKSVKYDLASNKTVGVGIEHKF
jgi:predicted porin